MGQIDGWYYPLGSKESREGGGRTGDHPTISYTRVACPRKGCGIIGRQWETGEVTREGDPPIRTLPPKWRDITDDLERLAPETDIYSWSVKLYVRCPCGCWWDQWVSDSQPISCAGGCGRLYRIYASYSVEVFE